MSFPCRVLASIELVSLLLVVRSEKKRLRKPSKWLLEYTEEYDQIFAPKKKQKKAQEVHKVCCNIAADFHSLQKVMIFLSGDQVLILRHGTWDTVGT